MEKYGTIPARFTKAWWEYIWCYYKWYFIGGVFALFLIVTTCVQCATAVKYDATVTYVGQMVFSQEQQETIEVAMANEIDDATENGKLDVFFQSLTQQPAGAVQDPQYEQAMVIKAMVEYQSGEICLFLYSKAKTEEMIASDLAQDLFLPVGEWTDSEESGYFVNLQDSQFLKELGVATDDLYMALRRQRDDEKEDRRACLRWENAKKLADRLIVR